MGISIHNDTSAMTSLNELNKNVNGASKYLDRIAAGDKIIGAQDDASAYAISERMTMHLRSLYQDTYNAQNAAALVKTASGGVENIVDELRNLRELAIESATDTNTEKDREILQKMFGQKIANINDIADTTSYNGKVLLNGRYRDSYTYPVTKTVVTGTHTETFVIGSHEVETTTTVYESSTVDTTTTVRENVTVENAVTSTREIPTTITITNTYTENTILEPIWISAGDFTIDSDGSYKLASDYSGTITVNAQNVKISGDGTELNEVSINESSSGASLWIENLNIKNSTDRNIIKFQGSGNLLVVKGTSTLALELSEDYSYNYALINMGAGLIVEGTGGGVLNASVKTTSWQNNLNFTEAASLIGLDGSTGDNRSASGSLMIDNVKISADMYNNRNNPRWGGALIGSAGGNSSYISGGIIVNNSTINANSALEAPVIGSGQESYVGRIVIKDSSVTANASVIGESWTAAIGSGEKGSRVGNIEIYGNSNVTASGYYGAAIGSGSYGSHDNPSSAGDIIIGDNATVTATYSKASEIGAGSDASAGNIIISRQANVNATKFSSEPEYRDSIEAITFEAVTLDDEPENILSNTITETETIETTATITETNIVTSTVVVTSTVPTTTTVFTPVTVPTTTTVVDTSTVTVTDTATITDTAIAPAENATFHVGARAGDSVSIVIHDMHTKSLGLDGADITTREKANEALDVIDNAITYALNEATNLGALLRRLEFTVSNLTTTSENIQAANSAIRNADMAREMTNYTKANVLAASAKTMLAQANQNSGNVLGLLQ